MPFARVALGLLVAYAAVVVLAWLLQERIAFPAPRGTVPDPKQLGIPDGERIELALADGTRLAGWYLPPRTATSAGGRAVGRSGGQGDRGAPGLLWFYGNGENIASIWPVLRDFRPPGAALLAVDYPGYGASAGRATETALYAAADAAYDALARRAEVDPERIFAYGRSLGSAVASHAAAQHRTAGLILESPFTSARDMAREHYWLLPRFIMRLRLDNVANVQRVHCPVLLFHGTADRLVPPAMGMRVAAAVAGPVEVVLIPGSGHNDTYDLGRDEYRSKLAEFVLQPRNVAPRSAHP